jgi:hypothetical protein
MISLMVPFWTFSFLDFLADLLQKSISVASNLFACCVFSYIYIHKIYFFIHTWISSARNGLVYATIPYWNFFLFLNFIPALNTYYIHPSFFHFSDGISLFHFEEVYRLF